MERRCVAFDSFRVGMYFMPFLFMGPLKDYLCLPRFGLELCRRSCPFQRCECRLPSNGSWSAPASLPWWVKPDPLKPDPAAACSSLLPSDSACPPPTAGLNTGQLSGRQLWFAFKQQQIPFSPAFFYLPVSSAHLFFLPPIVPLVPAALAFYPSTAKPQGTSSMGPLDPSQPAALSWEAGYLVVLFRPCKRGGGDLEAFETTEGTCCVSFQAAHYNQAKYIKLNQCFLWNCLVSSHLTTMLLGATEASSLTHVMLNGAGSKNSMWQKLSIILQTDWSLNYSIKQPLRACNGHLFYILLTDRWTLCWKGYSGVTLIHGLNHHETVLDSLSRDQVSRQKRPHDNNTLQ